MKKIIIFLISILFFTTIFMSNNINATTYTTICLGSYPEHSPPILTSFDGISSGLNNYSGSNCKYISFNNIGITNYFMTSTSYDLSSPNSFKVKSKDDDTKGYWNLTSDFNYISLINMSFVISPWTATGNNINMKFFDSSDNNVIYLKFTSCTGACDEYIRWYDISSGEKTIYTSTLTVADRLYLIIEHLDTNQFNITLKNSTYGTLANVQYAGNYAGDYTSFSYIYFYSTAGSDEGEMYFDNLYITYSDILPTTEYTQEFCNGVPWIYLTDNDLKEYSYIESKYYDNTGLGLGGDIIEVKLPIEDSQYTATHNFSDYHLEINGVTIGIPTNISEYDDTYNCYWLIWDNFSLFLFNGFPVFSFGCTKKVNDYYWQTITLWACSMYSFEYHNSSTMHVNNAIDYYEYDTGSSCYYDLTYCFTVQSFEYTEPTPPSSPTEFISTTLQFNFYDSKTGVKLQTIDIEHVNDIFPCFTTETSFCKIGLSITAISSGGNETHICPLDECSYSSTETAQYSNCLISPYTDNIIDFTGSSVGNIAGKVNDQNIIFYRYIKTISLAPYGTYDIYLTRLGEKNATEPLTPIELPIYIAKYGNFFVEFVEENASCSYRVGDSPTLVYYVNDSKYSDVNGYIWEIKDMNNVSLTKGTIYFTETTDSGFIPVNWFTFPAKGEYQLYLYNVTVGNKKDEIVYRGNNTIVCAKGGGGTPSMGGFIFPDWLKIIVAVIITLIITVSPLLFSFALSKGRIEINIPALVYIAFFFFGLIVSVILGLLSIIVPFIILFGLIIAFGILYVSGKTEGG